MGDYYNDFDPGAAAWLRELMKAGHIPAGQVDDRSILDVAATDLAGFRRCHFFAGIAGWSEALRLAGWPDAIPVWTGSPPCQPFSAAGKRGGRDDARHLGPRFVDLVRAARPPMLFGEQVASADAIGRAAGPRKRGAGSEPAWAWWDDLSLRLEAAGYAAWAAVVPAAAVGAPHIRERLFFAAVDLRFAPEGVANSKGSGRADGAQKHGGGRSFSDEGSEIFGAWDRGAFGGLADAHGRQRDRLADGEERQRDGAQAGWLEGDGQSAARQHLGRVADADGRDAGAEWQQRGWEQRQQPQEGGVCRLADADSERRRLGQPRVEDAADVALAGQDGRRGVRPAGPGPSNGFWGSADWLLCRDERWRPVEPGTFPLAHGVSGRVGLLRGYGNAIVPQAAAEFIDASREILIETGIWAELRRAAA